MCIKENISYFNDSIIVIIIIIIIVIIIDLI